MSRHKYLEEVEPLKGEEYLKAEYPTKWALGDKEREKVWYQERRKYGFDSRETWALETVFYIWLYEHLMMYKERASEIVDLTYHKFEYNGESLSQIECIDRMIEGCKLYIQNSESEDKETQEKIKSVAEIWALVLPAMWW